MISAAMRKFVNFESPRERDKPIKTLRNVEERVDVIEETLLRLESRSF